MAAAAIEAAGYACNIVNQMGHDIIMYVDGMPVRVEVKACQKTNKYNQYAYMVARGSKKKRKLTETEADILALVATDVKCVAFKPVRQVHSVRLRIKADMFGDEAQSLEKAIREFRLKCDD